MDSSLKDARVAAGLSITEVSERLNIRKKYLLALEEGNFEALPSKVYAQGYLTLYSKFLNLKPNINLKAPEQEVTKDVRKESASLKVYTVIISIILLIILISVYSILI